MPAARPMISAPVGLTKPDAGVMATRPATAPETMPRTEGFLEIIHSMPIQARVAAAVAMGADPAAAVAAVSAVDEVAGRYRTVRVGDHDARLLLAKNPAGWQEALSMVDKTAAGVVISVNGQVPDGEDLSWLWDVRLEDFEGTSVVAAGERGTDLAVRLGYAGVEHSLVHDTMAAIESCPPGQVEVVANYTAFLQLQRALGKRHD